MPSRFARRSIAAGARSSRARSPIRPAAPPGSGLVAVGGFAFAADGGDAPAWEGFAPASLIVPELSLARRGGETWLTVNLDARARRHRRGRARSASSGGWTSCAPQPLPLLDPAPAGAYQVHSPMPPSHYEEAVARAVQRIRAGELEKVVLAREVEVHAPVDARSGRRVRGAARRLPVVLRVRRRPRRRRPSSAPAPSCSCAGRASGRARSRSPARPAAAPTRRSTTTSASSCCAARRTAQENAIVARRIARALQPYSVWVTAAPEPVLVRVANIQHLATPIRAQLARADRRGRARRRCCIRRRRSAASRRPAPGR